MAVRGRQVITDWTTPLIALFDALVLLAVLAVAYFNAK